MKMVVHQHIGMDRHPQASRMFDQEGQQLFAIQVIPTDGLAIIAPLNHMVRMKRYCQSRLSGHGRLEINRNGANQIINRCLTPIIQGRS
jgi:hypothetical protein